MWWLRRSKWTKYQLSMNIKNKGIGVYLMNNKQKAIEYIQKASDELEKHREFLANLGLNVSFLNTAERKLDQAVHCLVHSIEEPEGDNEKEIKEVSFHEDEKVIVFKNGVIKTIKYFNQAENVDEK